MRRTRGTVAALAGSLLVLPMSLSTPAAQASNMVVVHPQTRADALTAMQGEAFAQAKYLAYADEARRTKRRAVERAFRSAAATEFGDHLTKEAALIGFVGSNEANLRTSLAGEVYESRTMYPQFARQARRDGCPKVAAQFDEIARDETVHAGGYRAALRALATGGPIPTGMRPKVETITAGAAQCRGQTLRNLQAAMRGESLAHAKYLLYAKKAQQTGRPRLAQLFRNAAATELGEHFAAEATFAGLVRGNAADLREAINGERYESTRMYPQFALRAARVGDTAAAALFREIAGDERGHAQAFAKALAGLPRPRR